MVFKKRTTDFFRIYPENFNAQINLRMFEVIKHETAISVNEIGEKAGVSDEVVAEYINRCVKSDLIKISASPGGELADLNEKHKKMLGVGFCGKECILTGVTLDGEIIDREKVKTGQVLGKDTRSKTITEMLKVIKRNVRLTGGGFALAGITVPEGLGIRPAKTLVDGIKAIFGTESRLSGEATASGYAEKSYKGRNGNILYLYKDVGVGVVLKDEIIHETTESIISGEGTYLRPWEQFNIVETSKKLVNKGVGTSMVNMVHGKVEEITLEVVLKAAEEKDELAEDLVKRSALALGVRMAYLVNIFSPNLVIMGGGIEEKNGSFMSFAEKSAKKFLLKGERKETKVVAGELGEEAASIGAALLCRREIFMEV